MLYKFAISVCDRQICAPVGGSFSWRYLLAAEAAVLGFTLLCSFPSKECVFFAPSLACPFGVSWLSAVSRMASVIFWGLVLKKGRTGIAPCEARNSGVSGTYSIAGLIMQT